ncbi:MAG: hypothetical protein ABSD57_05315 [Verrucomicrobiota bacterium]|jgi:hypothetical protein
MPEQPETKQERVIRIGPDQVTVTDDEVVIETKHEMPDWKVQDLNTPAIYFEDKKYLLADKGAAQSPYSIRYVLRPWPAGKTANAKIFHTYDAKAVAERDSARRGEALNGVVWACLLPLYPFLGLLWSGTQQRLVRFGYLPRTITGISIFTIFGLMLAQGAFMALLLNASARSGKMMIGGMLRAFVEQNYLQIGPVSIPIGVFDVLLGFLFLADVCMRYSHYLREDQWTGGFFEWLVPRSLRRNRP